MNNRRTFRKPARWLLIAGYITCAALIVPGLAEGAETKAKTTRQPAIKTERQKPARPPGPALKRPPVSGTAANQAQAAALRRLGGVKTIGAQPQPQMRQLAALLRLRALQQMARANPSLLPRGARPQVLDGWQVRLIDGDTFAYGSERIRIRGIDTPEKSESGGFEATQRLDLLLREGQILVVPEAVDKYGRVVADVYVNGRNLAEVLREEGYVKPEKR
jgi:hypothetical protein